MAGPDEYDDYDEENEEEEGDELAHQMGGMTIQEMRQREMALRQLAQERAAHSTAGAHTAAGGAHGKNFTFTHDRMHNIGRENHVLLQKLQSIAVKGSNATGAKGPSVKVKASSHEINRRKKEQEIARENYKIAQRLMNTKSAAFDRKKMAKEAEQQDKYLRNAALYPVNDRVPAPRPKPKATGGARPPWFKELPKSNSRLANRPEWQD